MADPVYTPGATARTVDVLQSTRRLEHLRDGLKRRSPTSSASSVPPGNARLDGACQEMESLFLHQLLRQMRAGIPKSGLMGTGQAEEIYTDLLDNELARRISAAGGIGLAQILRDQLARQVASEESD